MKICGYNLSYAIAHPFVILESIKNEIKWAYQRVFRGWDDRVIWSIDYYLANMIPVWLKKLKKDKYGIPSYLMDDEEFYIKQDDEWYNKKEEIFNNHLDIIIEGFETYKKIQNFDYKTTEEWDNAYEVFEKGFDQFKESFTGLWN